MRAWIRLLESFYEAAPAHKLTPGNANTKRTQSEIHGGRDRQTEDGFLYFSGVLCGWF
jgi:hypothetical protein